MNKKSFLLGLLTGVILTFAVLFIIGHVNKNNEESDHIEYLENHVSYENKEVATFKVFQVFDDAALTRELSDKTLNSFYGNTVLILGENFYTDQVITIENPQRIGNYHDENKAGRQMVVPVIDCREE